MTLTSLLMRLAHGATVRGVHTISDAEAAIAESGGPEIILLSPAYASSVPDDGTEAFAVHEAAHAVADFR